MTDKRKRLAGGIFIAFFIFLANAGIFIAAYNNLATPYILEEQRMINAKKIMEIIIPALMGVSVISGALVYWLAFDSKCRHE